MNFLLPKTSIPLTPALSLLPPSPFNNEYQAAWVEEIHSHCTFLSQLLETQPQLQAEAAMQHHAPRAERKDGSRTENEGCTPGKGIQKEQKGTPCKPGPEIRTQPHTWWLLRQVSYQG